jgi:hypothetical protein
MIFFFCFKILKIKEDKFYKNKKDKLFMKHYIF